MKKLKSGMRGKNNRLLDLIDDLPSGIVMAEIGCYAGESSLMFLQSGKIKKFYAVDPWHEKYNDDLTGRPRGYIDRINRMYSNMKWAEESFDIRTQDYDNVVKFKMYFSQALDKLPLLDFIYIDGNHTYSAVKEDITLASKVIKKDGIISGHDYGMEEPWNGVRQAVTEMLGTADKVYKDSSWIKYL